MTNYFIKLRGRRGEAICLECRQVKFLDGTVPERNRCHDNVDRWVAENEGAVAVRGWLINDATVDLHSVVRNQGQTFDITHRDSSWFLPLEGGEAEFAMLINEGCAQFPWA
ncbi:hypothetical protein [Novosphingobium sp.]|uniref:hypothetical protein n=1 Tax=Novosphingobium sp. TaxID=1874826 RepID=UPI003BA87234